MLYRTYGNTGKSCSVLGFGGMRFRNVDDREACVSMIVEAAEGGINYFDTAPAYFGVKSEELFGAGFRELRRRGRPYYCATKTTQSSEQGIRREIEAQLRRLDVEAIDFYHIWCILTPEAWQARKRDGVLATFRKLREEGLVRHVCVSSHLIGDEIETLLEEEGFEGVLFGYSAYNVPAREKAFAAVRRRSLGCVVMNPLGGGLIPQNPELFRFIKKSERQDVVEAALHFLWSHAEITTALAGFGDSREIQQALRAVAAFPGIDEEHVARVRGAMDGAFRDLCTGCQYCDDCPEKVPVPQLMDAYNHLALYGNNEAALDRLKWHWSTPASAAAACSECGQCEQACTQHLPIIERLKRVAALA